VFRRPGRVTAVLRLKGEVAARRLTIDAES
jgi:hypothetical protein